MSGSSQSAKGSNAALLRYIYLIAALIGFLLAFLGEHGILPVIVADFGLLVALFGALMMFKEAHSYQKRVARAMEPVYQMSMGNFEARIIGIQGKDQVAHLCHNINSIVDRCDAFMREANATIQGMNEGKYYRLMLTTGMPGMFLRSANIFNEAAAESTKKMKSFGTITDDFEQKSKEVLDNFLSSATNLQKAANDMEENSVRTLDRSNSASAATEEVSRNVSAVASSTEELTSSVAEISQQINKTNEIAKSAVDKADSTSKTVEHMVESANKVGDIINLINDIAEKINLLSLNATIEAARAGEAGKGFAVVASEVKNLSHQTAEATSQIAEQISSIQGITTEAVTAITDIKSIIDEIYQASTAVAAATEEQAAATQEIARNIQETSAGTSEVNQNVTNVSQDAESTKTASEEVAKGADDIAGQSKGLSDQITTLLSELRKVV